MGKTLEIDLSECNDCESCLSLCPSVFRRNEQTRLIEAGDPTNCPEEDLRAAISMCPADCIRWEGDADP